MSHLSRVFLALLFSFPYSLAAQETHSHSAPEHLGEVSFPVFCLPAVQQDREAPGNTRADCSRTRTAGILAAGAESPRYSVEGI
jgi:hypothetical protein